LDAHDLPEDGPVRQTELLCRTVANLAAERLNSNYLRLVYELPSLLAELHRAKQLRTGAERNEIYRLLVQGYRAADAIADKYGYTDLSARIIGMMTDAAAHADDALLTAMTVYVRGELFFANGRYGTGRMLLERAAAGVNPADSVQAAAVYGSLHMRAAILAGRQFRSDVARAHLAEAEYAAKRVPESVYLGTAFGRSSVRIHRVSLAVELGDPGAALAAARNWAPDRQVPAERRSHFHIDVARANMHANNRDGAAAAIQAARSIAPQHADSHPQVKELLRLLGT
jgi:hypothetical protein